MTKSTTRRKAPARAAKPRAGAAAQARTRTRTAAGFPFLYFGHGTSRVSDALQLWVWFATPPELAERGEIEQQLPAGLLEVARSDGAVVWDGSLLHVRSGSDFKYIVQTYSPQHLAWLHDKLARGAPLDQRDLDRVVREVSDRELSGPRAPKRTAWDAFDADLEVWIRRIASRHTLRLVVKDVTVKPAEETAWHAWSVASCDEVLTTTLAPALLAAAATSGARDLVHPVLRFVLRRRPPKTLSPELRTACIDLLRLEGASSDGALLAALVTCEPRATHARGVIRLLETHHPGALSLFLEAPTSGLLLDDDVYAAALANASACELPGYPWHHGKGSVRHRIRGAAGLDRDTLEWARRMFAITAANGSLEADAEREATEGGTGLYARSVLRDWNQLRAELDERDSP